MALFVGRMEFLRLHFFFFAMDKAKKKKTLIGKNGECKKEEIYFVQTAEHPV